MLQKSCPNVFLLAAIREILLIVKNVSKWSLLQMVFLKSSFDATLNIFKPVYKSLSVFEMMMV